MTRPRALLAILVLGGLGVVGSWPAAQGRPRTPVQPVSSAPSSPPTENLVVHGQKRFTAAPMPNQSIHDPADALRDPGTGAPIGKFGRSYIDADPVPPINPGLTGDRSPIAVGLQR